MRKLPVNIYLIFLATKPFTFDSSTGNTNLPAPGLFNFGQKTTAESTAVKSPPASTFTFGKTEQPAANTASFMFGKTTSTQEAPKVDAPFSFNTPSTNKPSATSPLQPPSAAASAFSFGKPEKQKETATFAFGNTSANTNQATGNIFNFGNTNTNPSQASAVAPRRSDTAPTVPFQFAGSTSTLQPSAPQKSFSFGQSTTSKPGEPFNFGAAAAGNANSSISSQPPAFGTAKPTSGFGAVSSSVPFGSTTATSKPSTATASPFQFGGSGTGSSTQTSAGSNPSAGIFSFGRTGATSSSATPFGATSTQPTAPPAFGSTATGRAVGSSQPNTGFNFTASANTTVPGVFQFGGPSPPSNQPAAAPAMQGPASTFSFGSAVANAPAFGATVPPTIGQPGAPPGGNMFSIGSSGSNANTKGRTFRTATRRRPK